MEVKPMKFIEIIPKGYGYSKYHIFRFNSGFIRFDDLESIRELVRELLQMLKVLCFYESWKKFEDELVVILKDVAVKDLAFRKEVLETLED